MESMNAFFSGKAVWYGGTGSGAQITGSPTGGTGSGSSFVPGYDENGVYIDMEVVGDTPDATHLGTPIHHGYADRLVEIFRRRTYLPGDVKGIFRRM